MGSKRRPKILFLTGIRSEYDIMYPVIRALHESKEFEVGVIVAGAHLSKTFGLSVEQIREDDVLVVDRIESLLDSNSLGGRIKGAAMLLSGLIQTLTREHPDVLMVFGDREEAIMGALAGAYMNIIVAHVGGGDPLMRNVDDCVRQAVTKLAHLHFTFSQEAYERVLKLGEEPWRVFETGNPALDRLRETPWMEREELSRQLGVPVDHSPLVVVIQHVVSTEAHDAARQMEITMRAVCALGYRALMVYPNSDAGARDLICVLSQYEQAPGVTIARHIPRREFVNLLRHASVLVGNSSAGIMEAPYLKLPVVNIGNRQRGRLHAENLLFVDHDVEQIKTAIVQAVSDQTFRERVERCESPYGDGQSAQRILEILRTIDFNDPKWLIKQMTF
ncbi:MAG: UDP-N-acetylglucosamine 2-epimerase [Candidatus Omnitrophota bacterium]|nr:UDP-N-acetylglucosamine 2-epimerase [Candidatus Omnitrophota bacterium]